MKKIMLVDDEQFVLDDLNRYMDWRSLGIGRVLMENSVKAAYHDYEVYEPDVVVSDIEMIEESGLDLLTRIHQKNPEALFIFLTCHPDFAYMREAMRLGSCDYLLKPVDYQELQGVLRKLLDQSEGASKGQQDNSGPPNMTDEVKRYVDAHLTEQLRIADIADTLGVSESTLMHRFRNETGWSVTEYIAKTRLAYASRLLRETDWSIGMISDLSGFSDLAYFSRVFRKITGMSPSEYRKLHQ